MVALTTPSAPLMLAPGAAPLKKAGTGMGLAWVPKGTRKHDIRKGRAVRRGRQQLAEGGGASLGHAP
jgi:hypothetical protein